MNPVKIEPASGNQSEGKGQQTHVKSENSVLPTHDVQAPTEITPETYEQSHAVADENFNESGADNYISDNSIADDQEDDDQYQEEEGNEFQAPKRKPSQHSRKSKRHRRNVEDVANLFDDEAGEAGDDEDEDIGDAEDGFIAADGEEALQDYDNRRAERIRPLQRILPREPRQRFSEEIEEDQYNLEKEAERLEENAKSYQSKDSFTKDMNLEPRRDDPKLFLVKCRPGRERAIILNIAQAAIDKINLNKTPQITSAVTMDGMKGTIIIEAMSEKLARSEISGIPDIIFQPKLKFVETQFMTQMITPRPTDDITVPKGSYVRIKRGTYKDDIAQVKSFDKERKILTVKLIPRLGETVKGVRPEQKFEDTSGYPTKMDGDIEYRQKDDKLFDGAYLVKKVSLSLVDLNSQISLDEIKRFHPEGEINFQELQRVNESNMHNDPFVKGEIVHAISGDLKVVKGRVESVEGNYVYVMPIHEDLKEILQFQPKDLERYFSIGDHVRVSSGKYEGDTGVITAFEGKDRNVAIVFSDITQSDIRVLTQTLRITKDTSKGLAELGEFQLHDIVRLSARLIGMIVKMTKTSLCVLDTSGSLQTIPTSNAPKKADLESRRHFYDMNEHPLALGDLVVIDKGRYAGKQGKVIFVYNQLMFIMSNNIEENGGVAVEQVRNVKAAQYTVPYTMKRTTNASQKTQPRAFIRKDVVVVKGPYKGLRGMVRNATSKNVSLFIPAKQKTVQVPFEFIKTPDQSISRSDASDHHRDGSQTPFFLAAGTPLQTPKSAVPQTPMSSVRPQDHDDAQMMMPHSYNASTPMDDFKRPTPSGGLSTGYGGYHDQMKYDPLSGSSSDFKTPSANFTQSHEQEQFSTPRNWTAQTPGFSSSFPMHMETPGGPLGGYEDPQHLDGTTQ